jgi:FkbM family methyltransferase
MLDDLIKNVPHAEDKIFEAIRNSGLPVVLFGAGSMANHVVPYLRDRGIEPVCICDNNPEKQGAAWLGLPVCSLESLRTKWGSEARFNFVVSVGPQSKDAIVSQLAVDNEQSPVWYLRGYELCGEKITYAYFHEHLARFEQAYSLLCDDFSRRVFVNILNAKLSGDFSLFQEVMGRTQQFDPDVVQLAEHEVLLDAGAYKGDVIVEFNRRTGGKHDGIIAVEPDQKTLVLLRDAIAKNNISGVEVYNKGAWHERAVLRFHGGWEGSSRVSHNADSAFPVTAIEADTIDNILQKRRVTYISMDIEGAEHNAILGARQSIVRWKPRIAVCVYHRREDLFDLILLLNSFVPQYRFFLRHYTDNQTETVLYAV